MTSKALRSYLSVPLHMCMHAHSCVCVCACTHVYACMPMCVHACTCVCVCVCVCVWSFNLLPSMWKQLISIASPWLKIHQGQWNRLESSNEITSIQFKELYCPFNNYIKKGNYLSLNAHNICQWHIALSIMKALWFHHAKFKQGLFPCLS